MPTQSTVLIVEDEAGMRALLEDIVRLQKRRRLASGSALGASRWSSRTSI
jgi:DNA-binding NtrC family response regulator